MSKRKGRRNWFLLFRLSLLLAIVLGWYFFATHLSDPFAKWLAPKVFNPQPDKYPEGSHSPLHLDK